MKRFKLFFKLGLVFFFLVSLVFCQKQPQGLEALVAPANFSQGWSWEKKPFHYYPHNLYEYIDGQVELYLAYDFKEVVAVNYILGNDPNKSITLDIYDQGTPLNAFGLFSVYRSPQSQTKEIGTEATVSDFHIRFYQDRYLVDLNASEANQEMTAAMEKIALLVSKNMATPAIPPEELKLLPPANLIERTEKYIPQGLLGHEFFPRGLEALYRLGDIEVKAFVVFCESTEQAQLALSQYARYLQDSYSRLSGFGQEAFAAKDPYHQYVLAARQGSFVAGVMELPEPEKGEPLLKEILKRIP
ncbi:MAG: hypothetical protein ONB05_04280 [candidate division KSB1 bacterium]|nr:hypothetical protein [candidate division KSB1 bacterium]